MKNLSKIPPKTKHFSRKCPKCGYSDNSITYSEGASILSTFNKVAKAALKEVSGYITKYVPTDNNTDSFYSFLDQVRDSKSKLIVEACQEYLSRELYSSGKGYAYLRAMIVNSSKNRKTMEELQEKKYGRKFKTRSLT